MTPRLHVGRPLAAGDLFDLPSGPARHVQVLRLQPGAALTLFDGRGGQWPAVVEHMGRSEVRVRVAAHEPVDRELAREVVLALGMPANERMDALVEKATELGAHAIVPLVCDRSVLRVDGERAERKARHWAAVAVAACEQCGRNRVPEVAAPMPLRQWLAQAGATATLGAAPGRDGDARGGDEVRLLLSTGDAAPLAQVLAALPALPALWARVTLLSGPEGGFSAAELQSALDAGFKAVSLGPRVLRADTAPLAALAYLGLAHGAP